MLFSSRVRVRIRFSVWLVNGYAHVFVLLSVVTLPLIVRVIVWMFSFRSLIKATA